MNDNDMIITNVINDGNLLKMLLRLDDLLNKSVKN